MTFINQMFECSPFKKRLEIFQLALAPIFLFLSVVDIFIKPPSFSYSGFGKTLIIDLFFLNGIHVLFTSFFIIALPGFKGIYQKRSSSSRNYSVFELVIVWLIFFSMCWYIFRFRLTNEPGLTTFNLISIGLISYTLFHALSQSVGISQLYYSSNRFASEFKNSFRRFINLEKKLIPLVFGLHLFGVFLNLFEFNNLFVIYKYLFLFSVMFMLFYIIYTIRGVDRKLLAIKCLFYLRFLLYPLGLFSQMAYYGILCLHGIEYLLIFSKVASKPETSGLLASSIKLFIPVSTFFMLLFFLNFYRLYFFSEIFVPTYFQAIFFQSVFAVFQSFIFLHSYIDGQIFRFNRPEVQKLIGPYFFE